MASNKVIPSRSSCEIMKDSLLSEHSYLSPSSIELLKKKFVYIIDSNRQMSRIENIRELLEVLERRLGLQPPFMKAMEKIKEHVCNAQKELVDVFIGNEDFSEGKKAGGCYARASPSDKQPSDHLFTSRKTKSISEEKDVQNHHRPVQSADIRNALQRVNIHHQPVGVFKRDVLDYIANEIGRDWLKLARHLGFKEGRISELEDKYARNIHEAKYQVLLEFYEKMGGTSEALIEALGNIGRRDLAREVKKKMER